MGSATVIKHLFTFRSPGTGRERLAWVDYAKGLAILFVVYRHVLHGLMNSRLEADQWIIDGNDMLYSFRMPLFFLLSGLFFQASLQKRSPGQFLATRVNTLLYPYLLWAVIQVSLQILFSRFANAQRSAMDYLLIFTQPRALDQLWYLFALFNVTACYLFMHTVLKLGKYGQLALGLALLGLAPLAEPVSTFYDIMLHYIFFGIGVTAAPVFFAASFQERLASGRRLLLLLPLFALSQYYFLRHQEMNLYGYAVIALTGAAFTMMLSAWLARRRRLSFLGVIGHYSLYIYLMHVMIASALRTLLLKCGLSSVYVLLPVLILASIGCSIVLYRACMLLGLGFLFTGGLKPAERKTITHKIITG